MQAENGIQKMREKVDTLIVIPNDRLLSVADERTSMLNAFKTCDEVLLQGVQGITDLITTPGLINTDFADVRMIMSNAGSALMGIGYASGDGRAVNAARAAISSPMLEASVEGARGMLLNVSGPSDLGLFEVNEAAEIVAKAAHPDSNIIFGAVIDDSLGDEVRITVIAAGFDRYDGEKRPSRGLTSLGLDDETTTSATASTSGRGAATRATATTSSTSPSSFVDVGPALIEHVFPSARVVFTDRHGGVSGAPYSTLNLGDHVDDDPDAVAENRARAAARVPCAPPDPAAWVVAAPGPRRHGRHRRRTAGRAARVADAAVTATVGLPLVVLTADCAPIALVAPEAVGVVHAGWPGLEQGVIGEAVAALRRGVARARCARCSGRACTPSATSSAPISWPVWSIGSAPRSRDAPPTARPRSTSPRRSACRWRGPGSPTSSTSTCAPPRRPTTSPTGATA